MPMSKLLDKFIWFKTAFAFRVSQVIEVFCAPVLEKVCRSERYEIKPTPHGKFGNPSITVFQGRYYVSVREVNYSYTFFSKNVKFNAGDTEFKSNTWICEFNIRNGAFLDFKKLESVVPNGLDRDIQPSNCEDARAFAHAGRLNLLWTVSERIDAANYRNFMLFGSITGSVVSDLQTVESPLGRLREKNWMPLVLNDKVHFVYQVNPLQIYAYERGGTTQIFASEKSLENLRYYSGSSQVIPFEDSLLCVVHRGIRLPTILGLTFPVFYLHKILVLNKDYSVKAFSKSFFFSMRSIEFCAGIAADGNELLFSYGVEDVNAYILKINYSELAKSLEWSSVD